jgi:hypothetical protein
VHSDSVLPVAGSTRFVPDILYGLYTRWFCIQLAAGKPGYRTASAVQVLAILEGIAGSLPHHLHIFFRQPACHIQEYHGSYNLGLLFAETAGLPFLPIFVVIIITPPAAREPYNAVAVASLRMVTDSISSGGDRIDVTIIRNAI